MPRFQLPAVQLNVDRFEGLLPQDTIFIHGNLASNNWWLPAMQVWTASKQPSLRGSAVCVEWRGCGKSDAPRSEYDLHPGVLASDYVQLVKAMGLQKPCLVGHSTGGLIALYALLQEPELFGRVVLLDPVSAAGIQFEIPMYDAFTQMSQDREFCATVMGGTIHNNHPGDPAFQTLVNDTFGVAKAVWHGVPNQLSRANIVDQLGKISNSMLILHGEHDTLLPVSESKMMAAKLPNAEFREVKGQGHSTNFENPRLFVELVNQFLFDRKPEPKVEKK